MPSEIVLRLERQIRNNIGNENQVGNGLPSTMEEVRRLAASPNASCKKSACRLILTRGLGFREGA